MGNMKRICFLNTQRFWGGGEKLHLEYALGFRNMGYDVSVVCAEGSPLDVRAREAALPVFNLTLGKFSFLCRRKTRNLSKYLKMSGADTLIFSGSVDFKTGSLAARMVGVPRVVYLRGLAVPVRNRIINRWLFRNGVTHVIANSEETRRTLLRYLGKVIDLGKVSVVYHGIDLSDYPLEHQASMDDGHVDHTGIVIGNAGRLTEQKAQHLLVEVAMLLKRRGVHFRMKIAGTGECEQKLREMILDYGLQEEVILEGFVYDIQRFMQSIDIFVLSSKWEGFGYVLVEAMAAGKPVVAFDISSNPEIVEHGVTGFLVPFPDLITMADRIEALIMNPRLVREMGQAGRERVEQRFELKEKIKELEETIND